jgi:chromosome segregation ATPase
MQTPPDKAGSFAEMPLTLRDQAAEFDRLQQENFNLKMRNNFLEEQLLSLQRGDTVLSSDELQAEVTQLQELVRQRDFQLAEQVERAARTAGILTEQLRAARAELDRCQGAQGRQHSEGQRSRRRVQELLGNAEMLRSELKEARSTLANELRVAGERKQRHQMTTQLMKRQRDNALEELGRVRATHDARGALVTDLLERVEALRRQKRKLGSEYIAKLQGICDEIQRGRWQLD